MNLSSIWIRQRVKDQQDHAKKAIERLPPAIRNRFTLKNRISMNKFLFRETIIFDPTKEVPEAIKVLDQKKMDRMKKYELRYQVEKQLRVIVFKSKGSKTL